MRSIRPRHRPGTPGRCLLHFHFLQQSSQVLATSGQAPHIFSRGVAEGPHRVAGKDLLQWGHSSVPHLWHSRSRSTSGRSLQASLPALATPAGRYSLPPTASVPVCRRLAHGQDAYNFCKSGKLRGEVAIAARAFGAVRGVCHWGQATCWMPKCRESARMLLQLHACLLTYRGLQAPDTQSPAKLPQSSMRRTWPSSEAGETRAEAPAEYKCI